MTQVGTGFRLGWVASVTALLCLGSCSSSESNGKPNRLSDGAPGGSGGSGTGGEGASGNGGGSGAGGAAGAGGAPFECLSGGRSCSGGVVYESTIGTAPDGNCSHPVGTCHYGCNPDWHFRDAASPICNAPPPGCDDAGHCADAGTAPGSEPSDAGAADGSRD